VAGSAKDSDLDAFLDVIELGFSARLSDKRRAAIRAVIEPDRLVVSREGGEVVGVADSLALDMTLPGPVVAPVAGVLGVSVRPTHRRQGRLRAMMRHQLDDLRARGEHTAVLTASESRIYQRFGYGPATLASSYRFEKRDLKVLCPSQLPGRPRLIDGKEALSVLPAVLRAHQSERAGEVSRSELDWRSSTGQLDSGEADKNYYVVYEQDGRVTGYAIYQVVSEETGRRNRLLELQELCGLDQAAYLGLWDYLMGIDLVAELRTSLRPIDEPVRWALSDYRRMRTEWSGEHTYVRLIDVAPALAARRYERQGDLRLFVSDPFCPWNEGCYHLSVTADGTGEVERLDETTCDISLDVSSLGSLYLGGLRASALAQVGLLEATDQSSLERAERLFVITEPPFCTTEF
jgi:predicted acetyltransferase